MLIRMARRGSAQLLIGAILTAVSCFAQATGIFENQGDLGTTPKPGLLEFDAGKGSYRVTGGGANMWGAEDALHFVWKRVTGDVSPTGGRGVYRWGRCRSP
jgi:hypothetical protein